MDLVSARLEKFSDSALCKIIACYAEMLESRRRESGSMLGSDLLLMGKAMYERELERRGALIPESDAYVPLEEP